MTPLGVPVDPDVYWRSAMASPLGGATRDAAMPPASSVSVAIQRAPAGSGAPGTKTGLADSIELSVNTKEIFASAAMARRRGRVRASLAGSGGWAGTATAPA